MAEATVGKIKAVITADSSGLSQAVATAQKSLNSLGSSAETTAGQVSKVSSALNPETISADVSQSTQALGVLTSSANRTEEQLSQVSEGLDGQGVAQQAGKAQHGIEQLGMETQAQTAKMEAGFKKMAGVLATAFATQKLIAFVKESVKGASDLGESINVTNEIFESGAQTVKDFAATAAKSIGQSNKTALDGANTFATFGKAAGLSGDDLSKFAIKFSGLASDLASFRNTSPEDAIQAIGAALRGESEPIRRYGVMLNEASLQAVALKEGIIKSTKEALTPQQRVLAASAAIFQQTSDAQGDFARTSDGLANSSRILSAQIGDLKAGMGEALLPAVQALVGVINPLVGSFNAMDESSRQLISILGLLTAGTILLQRGLRFLEIEMVSTAGTATLVGAAFKTMYLTAAGAGIAIVAVAALDKISGAAEGVKSALAGVLETFTQTKGEASLVTAQWFSELADAEQDGYRWSKIWEEFGATKTILGVTADIEEFDRAFNKVLETGPQAAQAVVDSLLLYAKTAEDTAPKTQEWADSIADARELAGRYQTKIDEVTGSQAGLAALTEATTETVLTQSQAFAGAIEEFEAYRDAVLGAAGAASRDFRTGLNEAQSASRALVDSMSSGKVSSQEFENALISQSDEMLKLQFSTKGQIDKLNQIRPAIRGMVDSMYAAGKAQGQTREETTALIKELGLLDGLDPRITAYLTMDISQIKAQIKEIESKLSAYRGKGSIYVNNLKDDLKGLYATLDSVNQIGTGGGGGGGGSSKAEPENPFEWVEDWIKDIKGFALKIMDEDWAKALVGASPDAIGRAIKEILTEAINLGIRDLPSTKEYFDSIAAEGKQLVDLAKSRDELAKRYDASTKALESAVKARDSYISTVENSMSGMSKFSLDKITGETAANLGEIGKLDVTQFSPEKIKAKLRDSIDKIKNFKSTVKGLSDAGFPAYFIEQVIAAGPIDGTVMGQVLLDSSSAQDITDYKALVNELTTQTQATGAMFGDLVFGTQIADLTSANNMLATALGDANDTIKDLIAKIVAATQNAVHTIVPEIPASITNPPASPAAPAANLAGVDFDALGRAMNEAIARLIPGQQTNWNDGPLPNGGAILNGIYLPPGLDFSGFHAKGGIATKASLGVIGEAGPEAIIPLSRMAEFGGGTTTNNIVINMPPGSDGKDVVAAIQDYNRRFGPAPFNTRAF